jgi:hypothetical protein
MQASGYSEPLQWKPKWVVGEDESSPSLVSLPYCPYSTDGLLIPGQSLGIKNMYTHAQKTKRKTKGRRKKTVASL